MCYTYVDMRFGAAGMAIGMAAGSVVPGAGTALGAITGFAVGVIVDKVYETVTENIEVFDGKSMKEKAKENARKVMDFLKFWD